MKYLFAINPVSGKGKAKIKMTELTKLLREKNIDFILYETQPYYYANDLKQVIIKNNITHVFAVGGDGTAHEVLNAVVGLDVYYGIIPFGSGNDFARVLNLPKKSEQVIEMIEKNDSITIDIGKVNHRYFLNYVSFGLDVKILKSSLKYKKCFLGGASYPIALIDGLISYKCLPMVINDKKEDIYLTTIHNGKFYGGGMKINPFAEINDGLLDCCRVKKISRLKLLALFPSVYSGKHFKYKKIVNFESKRQFTIDIDGEVLTGIDGELFTLKSPIKIDVIPKSIKLIRN